MIVLGDEYRDTDRAVSRIAAAIGEPARARILFCLMDQRARTSTELAVVAQVSPSTANVHLNRLRSERLVKVHVQGKHRYYSLYGADVAALLEQMSVVAGRPRSKFVPNTPNRLRSARTCYDHIAGVLGVSLHDAFSARGWLATGGDFYDLTPKGLTMLAGLGVDIEETRSLRRRFAFGCLDWSERRSHIGGSLGAALLKLALKNKWVTQELDSRCLVVTRTGRREFASRFGMEV
jgi:DNA-binding transcriptional ArsR family regulator